MFILEKLFQKLVTRCRDALSGRTHPGLLLVHGELLLLDGLQLVAEVELGGLLLQLGELVLVLGHLLQGGLDAEANTNVNA